MTHDLAVDFILGIIALVTVTIFLCVHFGLTRKECFTYCLLFVGVFSTSCCLIQAFAALIR